MGIQVLPNFQDASPSAGLHLVTSTQTITDQLPFELPRYSADIAPEEQDDLGCMRGVAWALGIQALLVILALGFWKLHFLLQ